MSVAETRGINQLLIDKIAGGVPVRIMLADPDTPHVVAADQALRPAGRLVRRINSARDRLEPLTSNGIQLRSASSRDQPHNRPRRRSSARHDPSVRLARVPSAAAARATPRRLPAVRSARHPLRERLDDRHPDRRRTGLRPLFSRMRRPPPRTATRSWTRWTTSGAPAPEPGPPGSDPSTAPRPTGTLALKAADARTPPSAGPKPARGLPPTPPPIHYPELAHHLRKHTHPLPTPTDPGPLHQPSPAGSVGDPVHTKWVRGHRLRSGTHAPRTRVPG